MKKIFGLISLLLFFTAVVNAQNIEAEKEAIKKVIVDAYVEGIFNQGDVAAIKKGWYYDCDIVRFQAGNVWGSIMKLPAYFFVEHFEKQPGAFKAGTTYEFTYVHVAGYAGIAVIEIFQEGKHIYTDFLNLYKFDDGWKIVTKTYYSYPKN